MIQSVNAILISSENPRELIDFYIKLGVPLKEANHGGGIHAEADFGPVHFAIWGGGQKRVERSNLAFSFHVPNLEQYCRKLETKGIPLDEAPHPLPFGGTVASLRDPDGNRIVLMKWDSDK